MIVRVTPSASGLVPHFAIKYKHQHPTAEACNLAVCRGSLDPLREAEKTSRILICFAFKVADVHVE